ncbi:hypothetical protein ABIF66_004272 [Bradyrhizobium japonicum]
MAALLGEPMTEGSMGAPGLFSAGHNVEMG